MGKQSALCFKNAKKSRILSRKTGMRNLPVAVYPHLLALHKGQENHHCWEQKGNLKRRENKVIRIIYTNLY